MKIECFSNLSLHWQPFKQVLWQRRFITYSIAGALALLVTAIAYYTSKKIFQQNAIKSSAPPLPTVYPATPLFQTVSEPEVLQLKSKLQNTNPHHPTLHLSDVKDHGFLPTHKLQIDETIYYVSTPFYLGGAKNYEGKYQDGRITVLVLVEQNGKVYPRLLYLSQSQGVWRLLEEVVKHRFGPPKSFWNRWFNPITEDKVELGHIGKGKAEIDTVAPIVLNVALSELLNASTRIKIITREEIATSITRTSPSGIYAFCSPFYKQLIQPIKTEPSSDAKVELPETLHPNFSFLLKEYPFWSPLYGDMKGYVYPSKDNSCRFLFCEVIDGMSSQLCEENNRSKMAGLAGKVYLAAIEKVHENPLTLFGNRQFYIPIHQLDMPLFEYREQIKTDFAAPHIGPYSCAWNVIRNNSLIQAWYQARALPLPEPLHSS